MAKLKKELKDILDKYGISYTDKDKLWDCHGTLVLYHKAYEIIAAQENIVFDPPQIIESNSKDKTVCICVTGRLGERAEWSFGEAAPNNNKNSYPYAMAEKRAKDRVVAKLVGLAAYVYSEDEADDFKDKPKGSVEMEKPEPTADQKWCKDECSKILKMDADQLNKWQNDNLERLSKLGKEDRAAMDSFLAKLHAKHNKPPEQPPAQQANGAAA